MTRDEITRMAREAGFVGFDGDNKCLREFAALVAAHINASSPVEDAKDMTCPRCAELERGLRQVSLALKEAMS